MKQYVVQYRRGSGNWTFDENVYASSVGAEERLDKIKSGLVDDISPFCEFRIMVRDVSEWRDNCEK